MSGVERRRIPEGRPDGGQFAPDPSHGVPPVSVAAHLPRFAEQPPQSPGPSVENVHAVFEKLAAAPEAELAKMSPVEVDGKAAVVLEKLYAAETNLRRAEDDVIRAADDSGRAYARTGRRAMPVREAVVKLKTQIEGDSVPTYKRKELERKLDRLNEHVATVDSLESKLQTFDSEWVRRGRWTRAFLATGGNGHVHSSRGCSTCNKGEEPTRFAWMTEYSGQSEAEIVDAAGERACTVCYPSAPVSTLNKPTKMFSKEERDAAERREGRAKAAAEKKAAAAAKAIAAPDGTPLVVEMGWGKETVKTERTARSRLAECLEHRSTFYGAESRAEWEKHGNKSEFEKRVQRNEESIVKLSEALAAKSGVSPQDILNDPKLLKSVARRIKEYG